MRRCRLLAVFSLALAGVPLLPATTAWGLTNVCQIVRNCRPVIKGLLPQSDFRPGGIVFVRGSSFGARNGEVWVQLQDYTGRWQTIQLSILAWSNTVVAGQLPDSLPGLPDQEGMLGVTNSVPLPSRTFGAPFTATRDVAIVPGSHIRLTTCGGSGSGNDKCGGNPSHPFIWANHSAEGWDPTSGSGSDVYSVAVGGGWVFDHYAWTSPHGINGPPVGFVPGKAEGSVTINWFYGAFGDISWYYLDLFVTGPIGVPF